MVSDEVRNTDTSRVNDTKKMLRKRGMDQKLSEDKGKDAREDTQKYTRSPGALDLSC